MYKFYSIIIVFALLVSCNSIDNEENIKEIHESALTIDSHCDTPMNISHGYNIGAENDDFSKGQVDFPGMKKGGLDASFFAIWTRQTELNDSNRLAAKAKAYSLLSHVDTALIKYRAQAELALTPNDLKEINAKNKSAVFLGLENGFPIGFNKSLIDTFYNRGVRYITLCHTEDNDICGSSTGKKAYGLTDFGKEIIPILNNKGIMIDVSHVSDSTVEDVLKLTKAPIIASHSCSRAVKDNPRNLSDDLIKKIAKNGGVIQVTTLTAYVRTNPEYDKRMVLRDSIWKEYKNIERTTEIRNEMRRKFAAIDSIIPPKYATVSNFVDHIDHIVKLVGIDYVGVGTDFDGGGRLADFQHVSQSINITNELVKRGYTKEEIHKIWGGNLLRVFQQVIDYAQPQNLMAEKQAGTRTV